MNKLLSAVSIAAITAFVSTAHADNGERWPRWYLGLTGGMTFLNDADIEGGNTGEVQFDEGAFGAVSLGYMLPVHMQPFSNMRAELEFGYRTNSIDTVQLGNAAATTSGGKAQVLSYMGNVYYDFNNTSRVTPYIGAGAGVADVSLDNQGVLGLTDESDVAFAYQFMAGLSYAPTTLPMTEWGIGYRYFAVEGPAFKSGATSIKLDDLSSHGAEVGAKFRF